MPKAAKAAKAAKARKPSSSGSCLSSDPGASLPTSPASQAMSVKNSHTHSVLVLKPLNLCDRWADEVDIEEAEEAEEAAAALLASKI